MASLPRIKITADQDLPNSGASYWDGQHWIIAVNPGDSRTRQRLTIFHEYKHILDHGLAHLLYTGSHAAKSERQAEQVADYFAGCVLVSRRMLKSAWGSGVQRVEQLAQLFGVSEQAIRVRLTQTGLVPLQPRCATSPQPANTPKRWLSRPQPQFARGVRA